jgi:ABC-type Fe3+ transport system substrate-binding protein
MMAFPKWRAHWRVLHAGLGVLTAVSVAGLSGCEPTPKPATTYRPPPTKRLTIITPHNAKIRDAFEAGFSAWHERERGGVPVDVTWVVRGTPQCVAYIDRLFAGAVEDRRDPTPDLMFGGGIADHAALAEKGYCMTLDLKVAPERIPATVGGLPTRGANNEWFASGLSSFGIFVNSAACTARGIDAPQTWADLADPRFFGWLGVAHPQASGSHRQAMAFVLLHEGWDQGWGTLLRILGNSRALLDSSSVALNQVEYGNFLAAFAVNFDALARADAAGRGLVYVNPPQATAATPDITSVLRTAADVALATDFVRYCLSESGQLAWGVRSEARGGELPTLYHYPIDRTVYDNHAAELSVSENPFTTDFGLKLDPVDADEIASALAPLVDAVAGENHIALQQAWGRAIAAGLPEAIVAELTAPPMSRAEAMALAKQYAQAADGQRAAVLTELTREMHLRYQKVQEALAD